MLNIEKAFIISGDTSPEKVISVASNQQLTNLADLHVDPTYNVGPCQGIFKTYRQSQSLTKKREQPVMIGPAIIHARKEYVSHFNLPSKLIQHKTSLNKAIPVGSDSQKNVYQPFKDSCRT